MTSLAGLASQLSSKNTTIAEVLKRGKILRYADIWRYDEEVVRAAVSNDGSSLQYADQALQCDKRTVLVAVHNKGQALKYASIALKADREVVLAALENDGLSLLHADDAIRLNKEMALVAVKQNGLALQYVSSALKGDIEVCVAAAKQNKHALRFSARSSLWTNIRARFSADRGFSLVLNSIRCRSFSAANVTQYGSFGCDSDRCVLPILISNGPYQAIRFFKLIADFVGISTGRRLVVSQGFLKFTFALFEEGNPTDNTPRIIGTDQV